MPCTPHPEHYCQELKSADCASISANFSLSLLQGDGRRDSQVLKRGGGGIMRFGVCVKKQRLHFYHTCSVGFTAHLARAAFRNTRSSFRRRINVRSFLSLSHIPDDATHNSLRHHERESDTQPPSLSENNNAAAAFLHRWKTSAHMCNKRRRAAAELRQKLVHRAREMVIFLNFSILP